MKIDSHAIAYFQLSRRRKRNPVLDIEQQREAVTEFARRMNIDIVAEYMEIEGSGNPEVDEPLPMLEAALAVAGTTNCSLIVANASQLNIRLTYGWGFMIKSVPVMVAGLGTHSARLLLKLAATCSRDEPTVESEQVSLAAAEEKAERLLHTQVAGEVCNIIPRKRYAPSPDEFALALAPEIQDLRAQGFKSMRAIAGELNARTIRTRNGGSWSGTKVRDLLSRLKHLTRRLTTICTCCLAMAEQIHVIT